MKFFNSIISAFAMYSRIPVPKIKWCEENRRYALGFFPLVGAVSGLMMVLWYFISDKLESTQYYFQRYVRQFR